MAQDDPALRDRQPWKAAYEHDADWFGAVITEHYAGDDAKAQTLLGGVSGTYAGISVEDFEAQSEEFLRRAQHPTLGLGYLQTVYAPMAELLAFLEANGFSNLIVSGSGADFMRPVAPDVFGIPPERLIGSTTALEYASGEQGTIMRKAQLGFLDDGPQKPIQIWNRLGRRPLLAGGNSNGDIAMLETARFGILINHDDAEREFAYDQGAEKALAEAKMRRWTVVSMKNDFGTIFEDAKHDVASAPARG